MPDKRLVRRQEEQIEVEKHIYGVDRLQKVLWYGAEQLDGRLSKNVKNIR